MQLGDAGQAGAGDGLVGGDGQRFETGLLVQRAQHGHGGHRGAVRVGDDPLGAYAGRVRVDLGDDERDLGVLAPGGGVVDHHGALGGDLLGQRLGGRASGGEQHDVQAGVVGGGGVLDGDGGALEVDRGAGGAGGGEEPQLVDGEVPLGQDPEHDCADLTGGADDSDLHEDSSVLYTCAAVRPVCRSMMRMTGPGLSNPLSDLRTLRARTAGSASAVRAKGNICGGRPRV